MGALDAEEKERVDFGAVGMGWVADGMENFCDNGGPAGYGKNWFGDWKLDQRDVVLLVREGDNWTPKCRINISPINNLHGKVKPYLKALLEATSSDTDDQAGNNQPPPPSLGQDSCGNLGKRACRKS